MLYLLINCKQPVLKQTWLWFFDYNGFSKVKVVQSRPCCFIYTWNITFHKTWPQYIACSTSKFSWGTHCLYYSPHIEVVARLGIITLAFLKFSKPRWRQLNSRVWYRKVNAKVRNFNYAWCGRAFCCRHYYFNILNYFGYVY